MRLTVDELLTNYEQYMGKTVYVYMPEILPDSYWGTIDCRPAEVREITITEIRLHRHDVVIVPDGATEYSVLHNFEVYTTKEEANARVAGVVVLNWYRIYYGQYHREGYGFYVHGGTCCLQAESESQAVEKYYKDCVGVPEEETESTYKHTRVELLPDGKMTLEECPVGLFKYNNEIVLKTEYRDGRGRCECYLTSSGERFCAGESLNLNQITVQPISIPEMG